MTDVAPTHASASYKPVQCCHALQHCWYGNLAPVDKPCWGAVGEDGVDDREGGRAPLHSCKGHHGVAEGDPYTPEPVTPPTTGVPMTDAAPLFTSPAYAPYSDGVATRHCMCGNTSTLDKPCYGKVERWPGWDVWCCEGHAPDGTYVPEKLQEGGDLADVAAAEAGQQTFLSPEQELEVLRAKVEALKRANTSHIAARQTNVRAINKLVAELATLRADAALTPKQEPDPQLIRPPDVYPTDLQLIANRAHEVSQRGLAYVHGNCRDSFHLRISLLDMKRAVDAAVHRAIPNLTRLWVDLKEDGYWLHINAEGKKAALNLGGGHPKIVTAALEAAARQAP